MSRGIEKPEGMRVTSVYVNSDLHKRAKARGLNLSQIFEKALRDTLNDPEVMAKPDILAFKTELKERYRVIFGDKARKIKRWASEDKSNADFWSYWASRNSKGVILPIEILMVVHDVYDEDRLKSILEMQELKKEAKA
jgi:hypothetical protein